MTGESSGPFSSNQFMRIAPQIFLLPAQPVRTALFCGAAGGVGCTSVCMKTAEALVRLTPESVCLVDANFRAPSLHSVYGVDRAPGFSDFLSQAGLARSFATPVNGKNLWLLATGNRLAHTHSLFAVPAYRARLAQIATEFRFVLIDAGTGRDSAQFAPAASGAILVIDSDTTRRDDARRVKRLFQAVRLPLLGVVVNRAAAGTLR
jgi:MinD-like ATPase involved in chromosome partitioning or flagellar assembly